ncbi:MAG: S41 family peptidase [Polaribacter sp.]|uniref:S41 family peptidase n=1 Tax=Polaribacter sp. TaxID=1920175 RepID=UPI0032654076
MKNIIYLLLFFFSNYCYTQNDGFNNYKIREDYNQILKDLSTNYIYFNDKEVDLDCIKKKYSKKIDQLNTTQEVTLFFEYLLDEFYDSHLILNTKTSNSFRLHSPLYLSIQNNKIIIKNIWVSNIINPKTNIIGAEVLQINGNNFKKEINKFPTHCSSKNSLVVREWIANKIISGRYSEPRILTLKLINNKVITLNLDEIKLKKNSKLISSYIKNNIGVVKINNSLGNNNLIELFDKELNMLFNTKALIIDLRNTVDGGNTYVARGIMGRLINTEMPYQKHVSKEKYGNNPIVKKSWVEFVSPRGKIYNKPVLLLVSRWTGSMGEGLAIGLDGMKRAKVIGTEMERLAGSMRQYYFKNRNYGYRITTDKLFHVDGVAREKFVPWYYVHQKRNENKDEVLLKAFQLLK